VGQHGLHCVDRGPLGTFAKSPGECREDHVLVALRESWSPRPPVRVAGLTRSPGPQISETSGLRHQLREYDRITVPSLFRARDGDGAALLSATRRAAERAALPGVPFVQKCAQGSACRISLVSAPAQGFLRSFRSFSARGWARLHGYPCTVTLRYTRELLPFPNNGVGSIERITKCHSPSGKTAASEYSRTDWRERACL
jgi:hypothetical protein